MFSALDNVIINDGVVTFADPGRAPTIVALANNTAVTDQSVNEFGLNIMEYFVQTTLSGIAALGNLQFHAGEGLVPLGNDEAALAAPDSSWFTFQHMSNFKAWNDNEDCAPAWTDPRNDLLAALNEIMFRVGVYTAQNFNETYLKTRIDPGLEVSYNTTGVPLTAVQVFHTDFAYFIGAAVVELVCILTIMYTFYGFWRLGRDRTFSPLEIAKVSKSRDSILIRMRSLTKRTSRHLILLYSVVNRIVLMGENWPRRMVLALFNTARPRARTKATLRSVLRSLRKESSEIGTDGSSSVGMAVCD